MRDDARAIAWWLLAGAASGAIAGLLIGGVGGRLAMLLLRLTSPDAVIGLTSDDGFEIGVVSMRTIGLLFSMASLGAANGMLYAAFRGSIPIALRLPLWTLFTAAVGGTSFVGEDGIDFTLLEPVALAITLFVVLPGAAAALVVILVERWAPRDPREHRRLAGTLVVTALAGTVALLLAGFAFAVALGMRRAGATELLRPITRLAVPLGLLAIALLSAVQLVGKASRLM
ncbi:MAG: hypothetical protein ACKVUT_05805 [Gaiella sp.]